MASQKKTRVALGRWTQAFGLGLVVIAMILAFGSYNPTDPSFNTYSSSWRTPQNVLGYLGSWSADAFFQIFGWGAWCWPVLMLTALVRWLVSTPKTPRVIASRWWIALAVVLMAQGLLFDLLRVAVVHNAFPAQGLLGTLVSAAVKPLFGTIGAYLVVAALCWCFCMIWWEELPHHIVSGANFLGRQLYAAFTTTEKEPENRRIKVPKENVVTAPAKPGIGLRVLQALGGLFARKEPVAVATAKATDVNAIGANAERKPVIAATNANEGMSTPTQVVASAANEATSFDSDETDEQEEAEGDVFEAEVDQPTPQFSPLIRSAATETSAPARTRSTRPSRETSRPTHWDLPPLSLLEAPKRKVKGPTQEVLIETARKITNALKSFEIDGEVVEISPGPIITMYEFQPAPGVRVQKIMAASTDLAMTLGVGSVRIVAPIPGKSVAGIEVPNPEKDEIVLRDVFESTMERAKTMRLPLTLGKDGEGRPVCEDLARMPHLLVGGATSMGKSVLVNSILTGLLCRFTPDELRLIIVDPKLVEFKVFEDIPHLLLPIVNDAADASQALKWAVGETKRRYLLMQKVSAKNLEAFNGKVVELHAKGEGLGEDGTVRFDKFPHIVIIIDELAELMFSAKKDVEQSIVRLTQLARAAGIHLIMATQRPSADVVTGLIKSNCPSRAALRVASSSDSRIILDCTGAEQLLGRGDMFFTNTGPMGLRRMQSAYVSDGEIEKICDFWRDQGEPEYKEEILAPDAGELAAMAAEGGDVDALYKEVIDFAREKGKISTSLIQRRFQIGYTRAARIMEQLEQNGVVGEQSAAGKPRDVVI